MKITFVINTLKVGGAAKMIKYVANLTTELYEEVSMVSMYDDNYLGDDLHPSIKVLTLGLGQINRFKRQFVLVSALKDCLVSENPDCVCSFIGHVNFIARLATLKMKNIIFISAERGDPYTETLLWKKLIKWAYVKSDYCFFQLEQARDFYGSNVKSKSFVIPNAFLPKDYVEPYSGKRNKTIVSAGRFSEEKCYDVLIKAFSIVHKYYPDYKLILYGDGPLLADYKKQVRALKIEDFVEFPGYVQPVSQAIVKDGIFVLSSRYEGIPNSLIEAMSVGIPCVATDCTPGGPKFLTDSGKRGLLVEVKDVNAMAQAIIKLIEDESFAEIIGKKALDVVVELDETKISALWRSAFKTIILKAPII